MKRIAQHAFTLVELLVVVAIIVALLAILLPSIGRAVELAERTRCASNLRQLHTGAISYASDNLGTLFKCRYNGGNRVQIAIDPVEHNGRIDWFAQLAGLGLARVDPAAPGGYVFSDVWNCPSREFQMNWEAHYSQMLIGYQYMGGIETWKNPFLGTAPSRSPVKATSAQGNWVLAADASGKIDNAWGGGRASAFGGMPPHPAADGPWPEGHNQVTMDGAAGWIDGSDLMYIHSWSGDMGRVYLMAQSDLGGWQPPAGSFLDALK